MNSIEDIVFGQGTCFEVGIQLCAKDVMLNLDNVRGIEVNFDRVRIVVDLDNMTGGARIENNMLYVRVTQEQSMQFKNPCAVQLRVLYRNGLCGSTDPQYYPLRTLLNREVLAL